MHSHKLMHRDLKPSNIFVRSEKPLKLCLADFDVSLDLNESKNLQVPSTNKAGTPGFESSDLNAKEYNFALDIQVFGIVAWRICNLVSKYNQTEEGKRHMQEGVTYENCTLPDCYSSKL